MSFQAGDTVSLKSGGPLMTISRNSSDITGEIIHDQFVCEWFDKSELKSGVFNSNSLVKEDGSSG